VPRNLAVFVINPLSCGVARSGACRVYRPRRLVYLPSTRTRTPRPIFSRTANVSRPGPAYTPQQTRGGTRSDDLEGGGPRTLIWMYATQIFILYLHFFQIHHLPLLLNYYHNSFRNVIKKFGTYFISSWIHRNPLFQEHHKPTKFVLTRFKFKFKSTHYKYVLIFFNDTHLQMYI